MYFYRKGKPVKVSSCKWVLVVVVHHWMVTNLVVYQCWVAINLVLQGRAVDSQGVERGLDRCLGCSSYLGRSSESRKLFQHKNEEEFG